MSSETTPRSPSAKETWLHLSLITGGATLFYINTFGNFFVWNDWTLIIENFLIKDWRNLPEIFTSAFWKPLIGEPAQIYRPLTLASFMADFAFWGLNPWGYHLTNIILHTLNSLLVYLLALNYVAPMTAVMAALLFGVHPIHTEAVTYISGRGDLLASVLLLAGILLFLKSKRWGSRLRYLLSLVFLFLALLAKETAAIFPLLLLSADLGLFLPVWRNDPWRQAVRQIGPMMVLAVYGFWQAFFVGRGVVMPAIEAPDFGGRLLLILKAIPLYLGLLLWPWNLHFLHSIHPASYLDPWLGLSVVILASAGWGLRCVIRSDRRAVAFSLLWFLIGLLPLVYFTRWELPFLEGWIYLPSFGFCLLVSLGLEKLQFWGSSRLHLWSTLLLAALLGALTFQRNPDWKDDLEISLHSAAASPDDPVAQRLLGNARFRRGGTHEANKIYQEALAQAPKDSRLHESLGRLNSFLKNDAEALTYYQGMRELAPWDPYPYWWIGRYYRRRSDYPHAVKYFAEAVRIFPKSSELHNDLASAYYAAGNLEAAEIQLRSALQLLPRSLMLKRNLEQVLRTKK